MGIERISCAAVISTGLTYVTFLSSPDSGYLFSGSRPPSQVSRSREVPVSGKETGEARGVTGGSVWAGVPKALCRVEWERHSTCALESDRDLCSNHSPVPPSCAALGK